MSSKRKVHMFHSLESGMSGYVAVMCCGVTFGSIDESKSTTQTRDTNKATCSRCRKSKSYQYAVFIRGGAEAKRGEILAARSVFGDLGGDS
jgi:hypothetical protein